MRALLPQSSLSKMILFATLAAAAAVAGAAASAVLPVQGALVGFALVLAGLATAAFHLRRFVGALSHAAAVCEAAARGDLEVRVLEFGQPGVVGRLQRGVNNLLDIVDAFVREAQGSARYVSQGKYFRKVLERGLPGQFKLAAQTVNAATVQMQTEAREFADFARTNVGGVVQAVSAAAAQMQADARTMAGTADTTREQATTVAAATEQAATNVQTVAAAAEQLSSSVGEISRQVAHSSQIAATAVADAEQASARVAALTEAAERVGAVVQLISSIARQTNLLALNATIEAARAGEAGKGFAVVASEVKSLANQTARATEEIEAQIGAIQGATSGVVQAIRGIGTTIGKVDEIATTIAAAVEEQGAATQEIARNVQEAALGSQSVSGGIGQVMLAAGEAGAAAAGVLGSASDLSQQAARLTGEIAAFLGRIRAA